VFSPVVNLGSHGGAFPTRPRKHDTGQQKSARAGTDQRGRQADARPERVPDRLHALHHDHPAPHQPLLGIADLPLERPARRHTRVHGAVHGEPMARSVNEA
jgi:hypothetical protein